MGASRDRSHLLGSIPGAEGARALAPVGIGGGRLGGLLRSRGGEGLRLRGGLPGFAPSLAVWRGDLRRDLPRRGGGRGGRSLRGSSGPPRRGTACRAPRGRRRAAPSFLME